MQSKVITNEIATGIAPTQSVARMTEENLKGHYLA